MRRFKIALLFLALCSCGHKAERIEFRVGPDLISDFKIMVSSKSATKAKSSQDSADALVATLEKCTSGRASWSSFDGEINYRISRERASNLELQDIANCGPDSSQASVEKVDGILSDTYLLHLTIFVPALAAGDSNRWAELPKVISVAMPGNDINFREVSEQPALRIDKRQVSSSEAVFTLHPDDALMTRAHTECKSDSACTGEQSTEWPNKVPVKIEISSVHYKYGFNELMGFIGLLFGSGVVFGVRKWFISRRS